MAITPMEIHNKEFGKSFRGYNEDQVDQFLDSIVEEFERLYKENINLKDRITALGEQINNYRALESTLKETLVTAQRTADDVTATAQKKAELIINDAEAKAQEIIDEANRNVVAAQKEYNDVKKQTQLFKAQFKSILETQLEMLGESQLYIDQNPDEISNENQG